MAIIQVDTVKSFHSSWITEFSLYSVSAKLIEKKVQYNLGRKVQNLRLYWVCAKLYFQLMFSISWTSSAYTEYKLRPLPHTLSISLTEFDICLWKWVRKLAGGNLLSAYTECTRNDHKKLGIQNRSPKKSLTLVYFMNSCNAGPAESLGNFLSIYICYLILVMSQ